MGGRRRRGSAIATACAVVACAWATIATPTAQALTPLAGSDACLTWRIADPCAQFVGHDGSIESIVASPDGRHVYTASSDDELRAYSRDSVTGALSTIMGACWSRLVTPGCTQMPEFDWIGRIEISPDGEHLYVPSRYVGSVVAFDLSPLTGMLTPLAGAARCAGSRRLGCAPARGLNRPYDIEFSADGTHAWVTSEHEDAIATLLRDPVTGALTQVADSTSCVAQSEIDWEGRVCAFGRYVDAARRSVVTSDDRHVYVSHLDGIVALDVNAASGALTSIAGPGGCVTDYVQSYPDCGVGPGGSAGGATDGGGGIAISDDDRFIYVGGTWTENLAVFERNAATGEITFVECHGEHAACTPAFGMDTVQDIVIAPTDDTLYVAAGVGLLTYDRDPATGRLTQRSGKAGCAGYLDGCDPSPKAYPWPVAIAASPDGANLYVADDDGIVVYGNPSAECDDIDANVRHDATVTIRLRCVGLDPNLESLSIVAGPAAGTLGTIDANAESIEYLPAPGYVGDVAFTYHSSDGVTTTSDATITVHVRNPSPPVQITPPAIVGSLEVGELLTGADGTWGGFGPLSSTTWRWYSCDSAGANCAGMTTQTSRRLQPSDLGRTIALEQVAQNIDGFATSTRVISAVVGSGVPRLSLSTYPELDDVVYVSRTITDVSAWIAQPAVTTSSRSWQRCLPDGSGCIEVGTDPEYTVQVADIGYRIRLRSTGTNTVGTAIVDSALSKVIDGVSATRSGGYPAVLGTTTIGDTLTADPGTFSAPHPITLNLQWRRCNADGTGCHDVPGETGATYLLEPDDAGSSIRVAVFADTGFGDEQWWISQPSHEVRDAALLGTQPPVNVAPPMITASTIPTDGSALYLSRGDWTGARQFAFTFEWQHCDVGPANCTAFATSASTSVPAAAIGRVVRVLVTNTNPDGATTAASAPTAVVQARPPWSSNLPTISGISREGSTITATPPAWTSAVTVTTTYQWQSCDATEANCADLPGATAATLLLDVSHVGIRPRVVVVGTNSGGSSPPRTSAISSLVTYAPPTNVTLPVVTGTAQRGQTLTSDTGAWNGSEMPTGYLYEWLRCNSAGGACSFASYNSTRVLTNGDIGYTFRSRVVALNSGGSSLPAVSAPTAVVLPAPPTVGTWPSISGAQGEGQTLTVSGSTWNSTEAFTVATQWQRCDIALTSCSDIVGATSSTLALGPLDIGVRIRAVQVATNSGGASLPATSVATGAIAMRLPTVATQPSITGTLQHGATVTVLPGTWTSTGAITFDVQWLRCSSSTGGCSTIVGATSTTYVTTVADVDSWLHVNVIATNDGGSTSAVATASAPVLPLPPTNVALPTINSWTVDTGTWTGSVSGGFAIQWLRCNAAGAGCVDAPGANASTYSLVEADIGGTLRVRVTASNPGGSTSATSAPTGTVALWAPVNQSEPTIIGAATVDVVLAWASGSWSLPQGTLAATWLRCDQAGSACVPIDGASGATYRVTVADVGSRIRLSVTGSNAAGSSTALSSWTNVVPSPNDTTSGGGDGTDPIPTAPTPPVILPGEPVLLTEARNVRWRGIDSDSHTYELRTRDPRRSSAAGPYTLVGGLTASMYTLRLTPGAARCWRVRIADAESASTWSDEHCWTRPIDDKALAKSGDWTLARTRGAMLGTVAATSRRGGAIAWRSGARGTRIAIVGYACSRCGVVDVTWNGVRIGRASFVSADARPRRVIRYVQARGSTIGRPGARVVNSGRPVWIDGIALLP